MCGNAENLQGLVIRGYTCEPTSAATGFGRTHSALTHNTFVGCRARARDRQPKEGPASPQAIAPGTSGLAAPALVNLVIRGRQARQHPMMSP